nr:MAG TPA: hypothetical protein [Bacteriophage sp.]
MTAGKDRRLSFPTSITSALLPRAHRQPAGGMSVDEYR